MGTSKVNLIKYHFCISPYLWKGNISDSHLRFFICLKCLYVCLAVSAVLLISVLLIILGSLLCLLCPGAQSQVTLWNKIYILWQDTKNCNKKKFFFTLWAPPLLHSALCICIMHWPNLSQYLLNHKEQHSPSIKTTPGNSLVGQWLGLGALTAKGPCSIPSWELRSAMHFPPLLAKTTTTKQITP